MIAGVSVVRFINTVTHIRIVEAVWIDAVVSIGRVHRIIGTMKGSEDCNVY
jgi:hypothetical protein